MRIPKTIKKLSYSLCVIALAPAIALAGGGTFQAIDAVLFGTTDVVKGAGTLDRKANSIHLRVAMSELDSSAAYSAWYVIFNRPEHCANGPGACGEGDLGNPDVKLAVLNAGGFISTDDGVGYFTGTLRTGKAPQGMCCFGRLAHGFRSEVHIVIQTHGAPVPGTVALNISEPNGIDQFAIVFPPTR